MDRSRVAPRNASKRRPSVPRSAPSIKTWLKVFIGFLALVYLLGQLQTLPSVRGLFEEPESLYGFKTRADPTYNPRISIVVVWTGTEAPNYLSWFLNSIAHQPDQVELILIQRGDGHLVDLTTNIPDGSRNIKLVQMSDERYWQLHSNYLCRRWGGCSEGDRRRIMHKLRHIGRLDPQSYSLSILRGEIFANYIHPSAEWWAWSDVDTVIGSLERKFPWDIADRYDVIMPTHRNTDQERLVFLRGHLAFFKNAPETATKLTAHPDFASKEIWLADHELHDKQACRNNKTPGCSPKEATYSSYIVNNPSINFLTMDALAQSHWLVFSSYGTYTIGGGLEDQKRARAIAERVRTDSGPLVRARPATFSDEAIVRPVRLVRGNASQTLWFDVRHSTHYVPRFGDGDRGFRNDQYLTYLHRLDGRVEERLEPVLRTEDDPGLIQEWMYLHYQEEKKKDWFKKIPHRPTAGAGDWIMLTSGHDAGGFVDLSQ